MTTVPKIAKPCPSFDSKAKDYGDYVTRAVWWTQAKPVDPSEMGLMLAGQLTGPAFQVVKNMPDQSLLIEGELIEPGVSRLTETGRLAEDQDDDDDNVLSVALGTPAGVTIPLGVYHLLRMLNEAGFRLSAVDEAFAAQVRLEELRRRPEERMGDFIFRFDMALAEARQHGVNTGDDSTLARSMLRKADISVQDQARRSPLLGEL